MYLEDKRTRVKICGLRTLAHARYCSGAGADFLGFIFTPSSKRYINPDEAAAIIAWLEGPKPVGVFKNQPLGEVNEIAQKTGIEFVQLHGEESPEYCALIEKPIIKAIPVAETDSTADIQTQIDLYQDSVHYFLFDTKSGDQSGGTGQVFDWSLLKDVRTELPFFIAGGIGVHNYEDVIEQAEPFAIDVNSSLEDGEAMKDFDKMEAFFERLQQTWEEQEY